MEGKALGHEMRVGMFLAAFFPFLFSRQCLGLTLSGKEVTWPRWLFFPLRENDAFTQDSS